MYLTHTYLCIYLTKQKERTQDSQRCNLSDFDVKIPLTKFIRAPRGLVTVGKHSSWVLEFYREDSLASLPSACPLGNQRQQPIFSVPIVSCGIKNNNHNNSISE